MRERRRRHDDLHRPVGGRGKRATPPASASKERLVCAAIKRDGEVLQRGFRSHYELRASLNPGHFDHRVGLPGDVDGFYTSLGRFLDRDQAVEVARAAGQINGWSGTGRLLLSSDISW